MPPSEAPLRIRDRLAGHHILLTGSTGFLAKVFLEKLLRGVDTIAGLHLLVRPRAGGPTAEQRVAKQVLGSHAFDRLRAAMGDRFSQCCDEKIHVVSGDLTQERFGLDPGQYKALAQRITLVVNCAATVTFDERLDLAISLNALGPSRLLDFAKACGNVRFLHVSTCYVCGARRGTVVEDFTAPESARESLPRDPTGGAFDLDALLESMQSESAEICAQFGSDTETGRQKLIELGMRCARRHGWNDTYTFTKWIGEQLLVRDRGDVSLAIFRPAIIESSFQEPTPGWIDGLRMADPMIVAYGRGKLAKFPGTPDIAVDLIPADFVANAMIATLSEGDHARGGVAVYQCASSERNPLYARELTVLLHRAFCKRPMIDDTGAPVHPSVMKLVDSRRFLIGLHRQRRLVLWLRRILKPFRWARRRVRRLSVLARQVEQLLYFAKIYSPYTSLDCRFADDALQSIAESLHSEDRRAFPFDVKEVHWRDYIVDRHVPGVRSFVLGSGSEPSPRIIAVDELSGGDASVGAEAFQAENLFGVFARTARRFPEKPALQVRRLNKWVRYTYDETLRASGTVMRRFLERGLVPGDRIAICGEGGPEWGLTYLAAMRAGLTAIPLDPQLPSVDAWNAARFAEAKLMCASPTTAKGLQETHREADPDLVVMTKPFIPPPAASQDLLPDPVPVAGDAIASILFTSGTTIAPKAVPLTHRNLIANASALLRVHPAQSADEFLSVLPTYHAFEFTGGFLIPLASGATITYLDQLKATEIQAAMCATGTTVMLIVPRLLRMFHDGIKRGIAARGLFRRSLFRMLGLASEVTGHRFARTLFGAVHKRFGGRLRMLFCGGSRLDPELLEAFERWGFRVYEGYGLTETSPVLSVSPPGAARAGSVGPVLPNVELEIRNPNLQGVGEVWVKGPSVMSGYLKNPKASAEVLVDGWFKTGDLGRLDSDGYLHLTGRSKDLIITGAGKNIYPDEVELRYRDLPFVKEMCVFGMPASDGLGDAVHAVIVPDDTAHELDPSSIEREIRLEAEAISESLAPHERIAVLHFWTRELPKTSTLKAKRNLIREMVAQGVGELSHRPSGATEDARKEGTSADLAGSELTPESWDALCTILARQSGQAATEIKSNMHLLLDLGIDSVGKIDILGMIEAQFDMTIDDETAAKLARVGDLIHLLVDRTPKTGTVTERGAWRRRLALDPDDMPTNGRLPIPLRPLRWLVRGGVAAFMNSYVRVRAEGLDHIPATGAFILAPNHSSHLDTPSVLTAIGGRRRVWVAGAADYFFDTRFRRFLFGRILDTISFDRQADGIRGLRRCGESLRGGDGLLIFPEGTRSVTGEMHPFKIGVAVLAVEQGVPIVPVFIHKTFDLFRKGQRVVRPGTVRVTFGAPIAPQRIDETTDHYAAFCALTRQVEAAVTALAEKVSV